MGGSFCPIIIIGDILPLYHMSTAMNQIIWIHQTLMIIQERQNFLIAMFKMTVGLIHSLLYQKWIDTESSVSINDERTYLQEYSCVLL